MPSVKKLYIINALKKKKKEPTLIAHYIPSTVLITFEDNGEGTSFK